MGIEDNEAAIILRALEPEDVELLYTWENDHLIWQVSNTLIPFSRGAMVPLCLCPCVPLSLHSSIP